MWSVQEKVDGAPAAMGRALMELRIIHPNTAAVRNAFLNLPPRIERKKELHL
jgi:hypothetical protein